MPWRASSWRLPNQIGDTRMAEKSRGPVRTDGANIRVHRDTHAALKELQARRQLRTGTQEDLADIVHELILDGLAQEKKSQK